MQIFNNKSIYIILYYFINNINTYCECYQCCECCKLCCLICKKPKIPEIPNISNNNNKNHNIDNNNDDNEIIYNSKIDNNEELLSSKEERCIQDFNLLDDDKIAICYKAGIFNIHKIIEKDNKFTFENIIHKEDDEYCFNKIIKLKDNKILLVSEDGTIKIYKIDYNLKKVDLLQKIEHNNNDPIYTVIELKNGDIAIGCWKEIIIYNLNNDIYEEKKRYYFDTYCFSILEIEPNIISVTNYDKNTLFIINLNKCNDKNIAVYDNLTKNYLNNKNLNDKGIVKIDNIKSGEYSNNQIYLKDKNLLFISDAHKDGDGGLNIIDVKNNKLLKHIKTEYSINSLSIINNYKKDDSIFEILCGTQKRIYGEKVNFKFDIVQFKLDLKNIDDIKYNVISQLDKVHYYKIIKIQNSLYSENNNNLIFNKNNKDNKDNKNNKNQIIFSIGSEDKSLKIFNLLNK